MKSWVGEKNILDVRSKTFRGSSLDIPDKVSEDRIKTQIAYGQCAKWQQSQLACLCNFVNVRNSTTGLHKTTKNGVQSNVHGQVNV